MGKCLLNPKKQKMAINYSLLFLSNKIENITKTIELIQEVKPDTPTLPHLIGRRQELIDDYNYFSQFENNI